jgi:hypothetical protein
LRVRVGVGVWRPRRQRWGLPTRGCASIGSRSALPFKALGGLLGAEELGPVQHQGNLRNAGPSLRWLDHKEPPVGSDRVFRQVGVGLPEFLALNQRGARAVRPVRRDQRQEHAALAAVIELAPVERPRRPVSPAPDRHLPHDFPVREGLDIDFATPRLVADESEPVPFGRKPWRALVGLRRGTKRGRAL